MRAAVDALSSKILRTQGDGDYQGANEFLGAMGNLDESVDEDLARIEAADIPVDVVFEQGIEF